MAIESKNYRFSGHQTFVLRHGWLEKGVQLVRNNPQGFLQDDVLIKLGVGKNMVDSIRYWCSQMRLFVDDSSGEGYRLSDLAKYIFGTSATDDGVDPFLEDDASLWLLHWHLVRNPVTSTWQLVFSRLNKPEFSKSELLSSVQSWLAGRVKASPETLERDIDCFVRFYAGARSKNIEELLDSPFVSLGLIQTTSEADLFRFNIGPKVNLPPEIVGYAILMTMAQCNRSVLAVQDCLYEAGFPGQAFKLDEGALVDYLMDLEGLTNGELMLTDTAGLVSVVFRPNEPVSTAMYAGSLLDKYYGRAVTE